MLIHISRKQIDVSGIVQGVGFRPFVWQLAHQLGLVGWVRNAADGVTIEVQGESNSVTIFLERLSSHAPPLALIHAIRTRDLPISESMEEFNIRDSQFSATTSTPIPADIAPCAECLRELLDASDRRYRYPFINCTNCGPRFSIIEDLPYDRQATTMHAFQMCAACSREYEDPADRRFQAQPIACPVCGPSVWFVDSTTVVDEYFEQPTANALKGEVAIREFVSAIRNGKIVAVKGIGGFHLVCDARSDESVQLLRARKGRVDKPFAIMVKNLEQCQTLADINPREEQILLSRQRPIVLLHKSTDCDSVISAGVAPSNDFIGIMLPYSPLHHLLLVDNQPLVMTSGNLANEPIVADNVEAKRRLANIADAFLLHNRSIHNLCDDSVVRCLGDQLLPIRRARGYAPIPIQFPASAVSVLAVGGELKSTFCITKGEYAYVSQHIGDMGNLETRKSLSENSKQLAQLLRANPTRIVADLHPSYVSTHWAQQHAEYMKAEFVQVQHHHAHLAALAAEHRWPREKPLLGFVFDGTGYGTDGAIWGGEVILMRGPTCERVAHLQYSPLPGGDASIRNPYRVALAQLLHYGIPWDERFPCVQACGEPERRLLKQQLERNVNCIQTSSFGRLFDAVASLIGIRHLVTYEAQAALELEAVATRCVPQHDQGTPGYQFEINEQANMLQFDAKPVFSAICSDLLSNVPKPQIAASFHTAVVRLIVALSRLMVMKHDCHSIGLTGGVFQNVFLVERAMNALQHAGFHVLIHRIVPANDGGLALGQAWIATQEHLPVVQIPNTQIPDAESSPLGG